jgi:hypothetical protein
MSEENKENPIKKNAFERLKLIEQSNKNTLILAKGMLYAGGIVFLYLLFDYWFIHLIFKSHDNDTLSAFGAVAAGTSGVIIGASTIVFLIYNIRIQNASLQISIEDVESSLIEMKDSNTNFLTQKRENMFFNLLSNHTQLVNNYSLIRIEETYKFMKNNIELYIKSLTRNRFNDFRHTHYNPQGLFELNREIHVILRDSIHIINFIDEKLEDKEFFHQTFYNSLTEGEKFMLGMAIHNQIEHTKHSEFKQIYIKYFFENSRYRNFESNGVIPKFDLVLQDNFEVKFIPDNFDKKVEELGQLILRVEKNYLSRKYEFVGVSFDWVSLQNIARPFIELSFEDHSSFIVFGEEIQFLAYFKSHLKHAVEIFLKDNFTNTSYNFRLTFPFKCNKYGDTTYNMKVIQEFSLILHRNQGNIVARIEKVEK